MRLDRFVVFDLFFFSESNTCAVRKRHVIAVTVVSLHNDNDIEYRQLISAYLLDRVHSLKRPGRRRLNQRPGRLRFMLLGVSKWLSTSNWSESEASERHAYTHRMASV